MDKIPGGLKYVLVTKVGDGPELLGEDDHLMDQYGEPLFCSKQTEPGTDPPQAFKYATQTFQDIAYLIFFLGI